MDDETLDVNLQDDQGLTPLMIAAQTGAATIGSVLVECGDADLDSVDSEGRTALMHSALSKQRLVASMILWGGADRNMQDKNGDTALHLAIKTDCHDVAWLIVENGGDQSITTKNKDGMTPEELSRSLDRKEITEMLEKNV